MAGVDLVPRTIIATLQFQFDYSRHASLRMFHCFKHVAYLKCKSTVNAVNFWWKMKYYNDEHPTYHDQSKVVSIGMQKCFNAVRMFCNVKYMLTLLAC